MMATVSGTNVQMEMVSRTHKCLQGNGFMDYLTGLYHGKNADGKSLTDPSHTANSYPFYLLVVLQKIDSLERKRRRLVVMTMKKSILEIISFVVHFINDTGCFCHHHQH
jgi:hypothetical protein